MQAEPFRDRAKAGSSDLKSVAVAPVAGLVGRYPPRRPAKGLL